MTHATANPPPSTHRDDALTALLETEHALVARTSAAIAEAESIVDEAIAHATAAERANATTIARELAEFQTAHERTVREDLARIAERARIDAARFAHVSDARVESLAELVVAQVMRA